MFPEAWRSCDPLSRSARFIRALICAEPKGVARPLSRRRSRHGSIVPTPGSAGGGAGEQRLGEHVRRRRPFDVAAVRLLGQRERRRVERQKVEAIVVLAMPFRRARTAIAGAAEIAYRLAKAPRPNAGRDAFIEMTRGRGNI